MVTSKCSRHLFSRSWKLVPFNYSELHFIYYLMLNYYIDLFTSCLNGNVVCINEIQ